MPKLSSRVTFSVADIAARSARLDLAHGAEAVMRRVDVDDLRLGGHQVRCGVEELLHVGLLDVRAARVGVGEALDADELVGVEQAPRPLEEQAAGLGVDVLGVGIGYRQPLVYLLGSDLHLDVDQDHGSPGSLLLDDTRHYRGAIASGRQLRRSPAAGLARRARTSRHRGLPSSRRPRAVNGTVVTVNPAAVRSARTADSGQVR